MYFSSFHNIHGEDRHMKKTYILRRHIYGENIHIEKTYIRKRYGGDTIGTYIRRGHIYKRDIHTEMTNIQRRYIHKGDTKRTYTRRGHVKEHKCRRDKDTEAIYTWRDIYIKRHKRGSGLFLIVRLTFLILHDSQL